MITYKLVSVGPKVYKEFKKKPQIKMITECRTRDIWDGKISNIWIRFSFIVKFCNVTNVE